MANNITTIKLDNNEYSLRPYGVCTTAAATVAKTVDITGFTLFTGATILVKFNNTNTAVNPTLNINSTGAKSIKCGAENISLNAGVVYEFIYDGANWEMVGLDTDAKVTSVDNHYTPTANDGSKLIANASDATAAWDIDVVKGVTVNRDAKGHVTGVSVTSGKIPSNPNTDTKVKQTNKVDNISYPLLLSPNGHTSGDVGEAYYDTGVTLNPSTNTITANISGVAETSLCVSGGEKGSILYQSAANTTTFLSAGTNGQVLKMGATGIPVWSNDNNTDINVNQNLIIDSIDENLEFPILLSPHNHISGNAGETYYDSNITINPYKNSLTIGTVYGDLDGAAKHVSGGEKGSIPYQSDVNTTTFLPAGVEGQVLKMGSAGVPVWGSDNIGDVTSDTDTKVNQTKVNNNAEYPLLLSLNSHTSGNAGEAYYDTDATLNPSTNTLTIGTIIGKLTGEATAAYNISRGAKGSIPYQIDENLTTFLTAGTNGQVLKMGDAGVPVWGTDDDTKVTSVDNHYTPVANDGSKLTATASGATAKWSIDVVKGVTINRDAKGHVTGVSVTSGKIPSDPNTDTKVKQTYTGSTNEFPLLLSPNGHTSGDAGEAYYDTGVTLNPSLDILTTKLKLKESRGQWKSGRTQAAMDYKLSDGIGTTSYHSILGVKSGGGNVVNIGGLADDFGFYGWNSEAVNNTTTENVLPTWSFKFNTSTGDVTASGTINASSFKEGNTLLSDKYVLKANMTDATTAEIEALFN